MSAEKITHPLGSTAKLLLLAAGEKTHQHFRESSASFANFSLFFPTGLNYVSEAVKHFATDFQLLFLLSCLPSLKILPVVKFVCFLLI